MLSNLYPKLSRLLVDSADLALRNTGGTPGKPAPKGMGEAKAENTAGKIPLRWKWDGFVLRPGFASGGLVTVEAVSDASDGLQVNRVFRIGLDFLSQAAHKYVDRAKGYEVRVAPDGIE